ncbi:unnamed protein product [Caenorhabditis sp. 36 PRJEB53466]|nr:unnamed protein product [Caenorhabditis sp. 36 PRJEB53466]
MDKEERKLLRSSLSSLIKSHMNQKGPIYIPMKPDIPPPANLPNDIVLTQVIYDPSGNEIYDIGPTLTEEETNNQKSRKAPTPSNKKKDATKSPNMTLDQKSPKTESQKIMKSAKKQ